MKDIVFNVKTDNEAKEVAEEITSELEKVIAEIENEIAEGKVSKTFSNAEDFLADLKK